VTWAGGYEKAPPEQLNAAIIYATVGDLVPAALRTSRFNSTAILVHNYRPIKASHEDPV